ncbi:MAG: DNA/RNA non-specific endonuclease, partial [Bacteroidales bacterium]
MKKNLFIVSLCLALGGCLCFSCGDDDDGIVYGQENTNPGGGPLLTTETAVRLRLETPATKSGNVFISHWSVEDGDSVMTYCLEYDPVKHHSRWVAFRFDGRTRAKEVQRKDREILPQYPEDPKLNGQNAIEDDARFNGYDHGHLCASADRLYSRTANDNTFYMTNMSPQIWSFNQNYWVVLEGLVQNLGRSEKNGAYFADTLYVVKGGTIDN